VKRQERLNLRQAFEQACRDARDGDTPAVVHRCNREPWMISMTLDDWLAMVRAFDGL
jgi:hypothetical protein